MTACLLSKPVARTAEDGAAMVAACLEAESTFMVGHVVRFYPEYERMKELLDAGTRPDRGRPPSRTNPAVGAFRTVRRCREEWRLWSSIS